MMRNICVKKVLVVGIIVLFFGASIIPSVGSIDIEKFKTPVFDGNILYVGGSGPDNYTKIRSAIRDASDGDTVFVYDDSSPYHEHVDVYKVIDLIGENKDTTIIDASGEGDVIHISVDGVRVSGFTLQNSGEYWRNAGIDIAANNAIVTNNNIKECCDGINIYKNRVNNVISDNTISSTRLNGIGLWYSSNNNLILNNTIHSNEKYGIQLFHDCINNNILGNIIYSNNHGIYVVLSNNNLISDNIFSSNKMSGMLVSLSSNNIICNNSFSNDGLWVVLNPTDKNIVSNNTVNNRPLVYLDDESDKVVNTEAGQIILFCCDNITIQNYELTHTSNAIQLEWTENCFIYGNILSDNNRGIYLDPFSPYNNIVGNTISNNSYGIYGYSGGKNIEGNTISNNGHGIYQYSCGDNDIYNNLISDNLYGVKLKYSSNNRLSFNNFINNSYGVKLEYNSNNNLSFNNFINNKRHAGFHVFSDDRYNNWDNNYWQRPRIFPKIIFGKMRLGSTKLNIPWINFDRNPAQKPYDIEV